MRPGLLRRTAGGAGAGAFLFLLLGLYLNAASGQPLFSNFGPIGILVVIGGTVGGLVAPLTARRREGRQREDTGDGA